MRNTSNYIIPITTAAQNVIQSEWKTAGISEALQVGVKELGSLDPFLEIDTLIEREGDENSANFNATETDIAVYSRSIWRIPTMIVILEAFPNEKWR